MVVAFILLTENLGARMYPAGGAAWRRVLIPVAGALSTGYFLHRYFPNARGSGIPQTKTALFLRDGFISLRTVLGKFSMCSVTLASGIALGREGPSVQVGAGIASVLGRRLGLCAGQREESLVPVGAAAALAAAFNTPIAAVLFTLEEVMGDMHAPVLGSIVLSSATSWMVLHLLLGDEPLFHVPAYQLVHPLEFAGLRGAGRGGRPGFGGIRQAAAVAAQILPAAAGVHALVSAGCRRLCRGAARVVRARTCWASATASSSQALNGQMVLGTMALLVCLKLVATATCYCFGQRRRHLRPEPVHRRDAGRRGGRGGAHR